MGPLPKARVAVSYSRYFSPYSWVFAVSTKTKVEGRWRALTI
jgi:hypothetical protein